MTTVRTARLLVISLATFAAQGCGRAPPPPRAVPVSQAAAAVLPEAVRSRLLDGAMAVLGRLENYDEASAAAQVFDRLNQWSHSAWPADPAAWAPDPLLGTLSEGLRPSADDRALAATTFDAAGDIMAVRDAEWLAQVARQARGDAAPDAELEVAARLFQWTIRSLALVSDPPMVPSSGLPGSRWMLPGEILLAGRASAPQRAWIFLLLLRQAGIDGVMLATSAAAGPPRPWLPAAIIGGEAYLFDVVYGMPIPGPGGEGVATARQAGADAAILESMSLPDRPYPVQAGDVAELCPLVAADPWSLSRRMAALGRELEQSSSIRLAIDATAVATRAAAALVKPAPPRLWDFPWETLARRRADGAALARAVAAELAPMAVMLHDGDDSRRERGLGPRVTRPLFAGRLRDFRGEFDGPDGAKASYLAARPSRAAITAALERASPDQAAAQRRLYEQMKEDATYWLGVLTLAEGEYAAAVDYLRRMTLEAAPDGRWADASRLNLAEALIGLGRREEAIALLRDDPSPQRFGSRLLARRLEAAASSAGGTVGDPAVR